MFINLTNHPSANWSCLQREEALRFGKIVDMPFPVILPNASSVEVQLLAETYVSKVMEEMMQEQCIVVHIMGEMTFTYKVVSLLKEEGITCLASTTERNVIIEPDGKKISEFTFVQFREY